MCVHLSEFPAPRTDLLTATATLSNFSTNTPARPRPTTSLGNPLGGEAEILTPSSDVQREHQSVVAREMSAIATASGLNIPATGTATGTATAIASAVTSVKEVRSTAAGSDAAASSSLSAVTIEKNAELRITKLIAIKHMLDLVKPLHEALKGTSSTLLKTYREVGKSIYKYEMDLMKSLIDCLQ